MSIDNVFIIVFQAMTFVVVLIDLVITLIDKISKRK